MIERGGVFWVDFGRVAGSAPAKRRPAVVVQADVVNRSAIGWSIVAAITSNTSLAEIPGNVFLPASASGLPKDRSSTSCRWRRCRPPPWTGRSGTSRWR